ncbi:MAG: hypothetical protein DAHOPDDO_01376 [Ignavibacteriaceae bacterium]|nr:hypothetical protein [Ignavibacteriaceae bacterium]
MKKLYLFVLLPFITFAQLDYDGELRFDLINRGSSWNVTIKLTALSARWDADFELTEYYEIVSSSASNPDHYIDFDHILNPGNESEFAIGLYKISAIENGSEQAYFFVDWRTSDWNSSLDIYFKYDVGNNNFRNWGNTETINYSYQTLWDLTDNNLITAGLGDYWDNCLAVTNDANYHPRLVFGPYPYTLQGTITGYKLYRSASHIPGQHPSNFTLLETLEPDEYYYVDNTVIIGNDYNAKSYYVKCVYEDPWESTGETGPTNTVEVRLAPPSKISVPGNHNGLIYDYMLEQNYPNPFNPSTIISWQNPADAFVILKVFDILGREVTTLVNEQKEAGAHSVEFDSEGLPSGIYLYKIQIGNYSEIRKMILQK